jgi:hypothetical protein
LDKAIRKLQNRFTYIGAAADAIESKRQRDQYITLDPSPQTTHGARWTNTLRALSLSLE